MPKPQRIVEIVGIEVFDGDWGAQIAVAELRLSKMPAGMRLRCPVFRGPTGIFPGLPLIAGEAPGSRYPGLYFVDEADRERFVAAFRSEIGRVAPSLCAGEKPAC